MNFESNPTELLSKIITFKELKDNKPTLLKEQVKTKLYEKINKRLIENELPLQFDLNEYSEFKDDLISELKTELSQNGYKVTIVDEEYKRNLAIQLLNLYGFDVTVPQMKQLDFIY